MWWAAGGTGTGSSTTSSGSGSVSDGSGSSSGAVAGKAAVTALRVPVAAHCVAWNGADGSLLAVGDSRGVVSVWQVSPRLATLQPEDRAVLDKLSVVTLDDAE